MALNKTFKGGNLNRYVGIYAITAFGRLRQEDHELNPSLGYTSNERKEGGTEGGGKEKDRKSE